MKITRVESIPVRVPVSRIFYESTEAGTKLEWGRRSRRTPTRPDPVVEYVLVRIETDAGIVGIGESPADIGFFGETLEQVRAGIEEYLGPQLIGRDPYERDPFMWAVDYPGNTCAKSGLELALYDLLGRALGVPVSVLLGGNFRRRVPVAIEISGGSPADMAALCVEYVRRGVRAFKPKIGGIPERDAERLRAIREAVGPDVSLRADANQGYTPKEAIRLCRLADAYGVALELLEQPVARGDLPGMALVRRSVETLIEADESCYSPEDAIAIVRHDAADVLNIKIAKAGGLSGARKIAAIADGAGLQCVLGTAFGLGPKVAAKLHLAASLPGIRSAVEFTELGVHGTCLRPPWDRGFSLPLEDGCLAVPDGPGLGVEVDWDAVAEYRVSP